ncbi:hypothetical protein ACPXBC_31965, partial [Escherichia coli]|uniref:hypothetical protein n=1 Tax=Escherichia coli TaxID=562 RepID=UPI003CE5A7FC
RLAVTSAGLTVYSNTATVGLHLQATTITATPQLLSNGSTSLQVSAPATNGACNGNYSTQWQSSKDRINWQDE